MPFNRKNPDDSKYIHLGKLGRGAFGHVYAAIRRTDQQPVAVKVLERCSHDDLDSTVLSEVTFLQRLRGTPGVVRLLDYAASDDYHYIVLERHPVSTTLFQILRKRELQEEQARVIFTNLVDTVTFCLHVKKVLHGDIKSENILTVREEGKLAVKLIDFGGAQHFRPKKLYRKFRGTLLYSPPEWILRKNYYGEPLTVWTLGILLFIMLQRSVPFHSPKDIKKGCFFFRKRLTSSCRDLIRKCLAKDYRKRITLKEILNHAWCQK